MTPSDVSDTSSSTCQRVMEGIICDEQELCISVNIPIPFQVNIVNVADWLSPSLFQATTFPKAGFAMFGVILTGTNASGGNPCGDAGNEQYVGWSYQYTRGTGDVRTALIFPIHRQVNGQ